GSWSTARTKSTSTPFRSMIAVEMRMSPSVFETSGAGFSVQFTYSARRSEKSQRLVVHSSSWNEVRVMGASGSVVGRQLDDVAVGIGEVQRVSIFVILESELAAVLAESLLRTGQVVPLDHEGDVA